MTITASTKNSGTKGLEKRWAVYGLLALAAFLAVCELRSAAAQSVADYEGPTLILVSAPASELGVNIADINDQAAQLLHLKSTAGVEVIAVDHDAPAGKAGIHLRDVILAVDGKVVNSAQQFREILRGYAPQKMVSLAGIRDGKPIKFSIKLADRAKLQQQSFRRRFSPRMPSFGNSFNSAVAMQQLFSGDVPAGPPADGSNEDASDSSQPQHFGFFGIGAELDPIGPQLASYFGVKDGTGMLVKSVESGSPAAAAGLQAGDVVLKLNDETILSPVDCARAIGAGQGKPMQLTIVRNKHTQTLTLMLPHTQAFLEWPE